MAPTRSGKGVGTIIPNLLLLDRSVICIDPKGENARVTARARATKGKVWCLDPFGVSGQPPARYNPLDRLDSASLDLAEDANTLADAPGQSGEAHWNEEAKALIAGLILHTVVHKPADRRVLATVRDKLTLAPAGFAALLADMQNSAGAGGLITRAANRQLGKSDREAAGSSDPRLSPFDATSRPFWVDPQLPAQRRERSLRSLYFCSDGVRGRVTPVTYLPHAASFHSNERIAPSNRGTKHLGRW